MNSSKVWIWLGIGAAVGVAIAASTTRGRSRARWAIKKVSGTVAGGEDLAEMGKDIIERLGAIYVHGRAVVDEANELWEHSRRLVRRAA